MVSTLVERLSTLSVEKRRLLVQRLDPLSFIQERLWFLHQFAPDLPVYNVPLPVAFTGPLDVLALVRSLRAVAARHETLRTVFPSVDGQPVQYVSAVVAVPVPCVDLGALPGATREHAQQRLLDREVRRVFDVERGPLWRCLLIRQSSERHVLMFTWHHLVYDGWSRGVLFNELGALYDAFTHGRQPSLPPLTVQYRQFARWQRARLQGEEQQAQLAYWRAQLAGAPSTLDLPTDRPRPAHSSYRGVDEMIALPADTAAGLRALSRDSGVTLFMTLVAAWALLMRRYSGQADLVIGTVTSGRTRREVEPLIGCFVNTLALRVSLAGRPTVRELLARVRDTALGAYAHQDLPFEKLVDELQPERRLDRSAIFQTFVMLQNTPGGDAAASDGGVKVEELAAADRTSRFDLALSLMDTPDALLGPLRYATDLFDRATIVRLLGHFEQLLGGMVARPDAPISELSLLTPAERAQILSRADAAACPSPDEAASFVARFEACVDRVPEAIAVTCGLASVSYGELDARANQLAWHLRAQGVGPDALVAICLERSPELVMAMLAIAKAGGAYIPLDPAYPQARIAMVLADANPRVIVTEQPLTTRLPAHDGVTICLDAPSLDGASLDGASLDGTVPDGRARSTRSRTRLPERPAPQTLAYAIFTSGSTGRPKGVMVPHGTVVNVFTAVDRLVALPDDLDRRNESAAWLAVSSPSFDIAVLELIWPLTRGMRVVLQPADRAVMVRRPPRRTHFSLFYFASDADGEGVRGRQRYRLLLDGAAFADTHGFDAVWMPERHFHSFGGIYPNPSVTAAAVAAITRHVKIRAGSVVLPLHDPIRVAEEWAVVDNLSDGRVGISFASGWHADDFVLAPERYQTRRETMRDGLATVRALWRGESIVRRGGAGNEVEIRVRPSPVQAELPIWITASGAPDTFRQAGLVGANVLTHLLGQSVEELAEKVAIYRDAWREAGHPAGAGQVTLMLHTFLGSDPGFVKETVRGPFSAYLKDSAGLLANLARSLGQSAAVDMLAPDDLAALIGHAFNRYFETSGLFGTPETVLAMVHRLQDIGVDEIACLVDFGIAPEAVLDGLRQVAWLKRLVDREWEQAESGQSAAGLMIRHGVTHLQCTPSWARLLLFDEQAPAALHGLEHMVVGGEAMPATLASQLRARLRGVLHNAYGPTETTVWSSSDVVRDTSTITLGQPIANTQIHVVDDDGQSAPVGIPGELCIGGDGVVRGYLHRPDLTAERFVPDPFGAVPGGRLYRTGDRGRRRADERIEFLGRLDQQVKLRGYRIELGEIEAALRRQTEIRDAAVLLREDVPGEPRLVAYVVPAATGSPMASPALASPAMASPALTADLVQQRLRTELPDYMVPAIVMTLDALPLTPNGKIDRRQLPAPTGERPSLGERYVAPRTPEEETLAQIWAEVLRLDRVGVHDNFFALGGDSILSLQIIARAMQAGLRLAPRQIFEHQTVAALAQVAQVAIGTRADQAPLTGPVPLLPVQHWFFSQARPAPHHYNQQVRLELTAAPAMRVLQRAWAALLAHHDALRFRFARHDERGADDAATNTGAATGAGWTQTAAAVEAAAPVIPVIDLAGVAPAAEARLQSRVATAVQASLDLTHGPVARLAVIKGISGTLDALFVLHHLVVDGVSWRILLADFQDACRQLQAGEPIALPPKTSSVRQWADALRALATGGTLDAELPVWNQMSGPAASLPRDWPDAANTGRTARAIDVTLSREETQALIQDLPAHGVGHVQELLLSALTQALMDWTGQTTWRIDLEGHGREELSADVDASRTVGWFTALYPVRLAAAADPMATLRSVKTTLRSVPQHGLGYGVLRYLDVRAETAAMRVAPNAEIIFNYLGQADQVLAPAGPVRPSSRPAGEARDRHQPREYALEINGLVAGGCLRMSWTYGAAAWRPETIAGLTRRFVDAVRALIGASRDRRASRPWLVPADVPLAAITQEELDQLAARGPIADIYPLSPMQQGLLFHSVYEADSAPDRVSARDGSQQDAALYIIRFRAAVEGRLDVEAFRRAWQMVIARHDTLRAAFVWNRADRPLQVVYDTAELPCRVEDWRALPAAEREARLAATIAEDERQGFPVESAPLMRIALIRLEEERWYAIWAAHHLILDGWSGPLVMGEVLMTYDALVEGRPVPEVPAGHYRDYIAWLQRQDMADAERYWRGIFKGFTSPSLIASGTRSTLHRSASKGMLRGTVEPLLTGQLLQLGRTHALTLNTWLVGAWALLLAHHTSRNDVLFGAVVSGRPPQVRDIERTPGLFVNTLPVRVAVDPGERLVAWLGRLQAQQTDARDYEYTPLGQIQTWSGSAPGVPLFDTLFIYENYPVEQASGDRAGIRIVRSDEDVVIPTAYPLVLQLSPFTSQSGESSIGIEVIYDAARLAGGLAQDVLESLPPLLDRMTSQPDCTLDALLDLLAAAGAAKRAQERDRAQQREQGRLKALRRVPSAQAS